MFRNLMTGLTAAALLIAVTGCSSTSSTTPRWGYAGPPPLFAHGDGYVKDQTATGPIPWWGQGTNVPGSRRYANWPGLPRSGTRLPGRPGRPASQDSQGFRDPRDLRDPPGLQGRPGRRDRSGQWASRGLLDSRGCCWAFRAIGPA